MTNGQNVLMPLRHLHPLKLGKNIKSVRVKRRVDYPLLVVVAACICGFTQQAASARVGPQIVITLPDSIPPEVVWVRYTLYGPEGRYSISQAIWMQLGV